MKKIIKLLGIVSLVLGGMASCTLEAENYVEKGTDNFPVTAEDALQALAGIYQNLNLANATPQKTFFYVSLLASDDCLGGGGNNDQPMQSLDLLLNFELNMTEQFWNDRYQGINRANSLLDGLGNIELTEGEKNQIEGEAKFLRAFYYYELASQYGRVPLTITSAAADAVQPTAAELWGQILQDLHDAATIMPAERKTDGHVDKFTASAMLGRAWLFYTGFYCNGEELTDLVSTNYAPLTSVALPNGTTLTKEMVSELVDECVSRSGYSLVPDYRNLWPYTNRCTVEDYDYTAGQGLKWVEDDSSVNPESMFAIKFNKLASWDNTSTTGYANNYALHFGVRGQSGLGDSFPFGMGWGAGPVAPNLITDWRNNSPGDMRRDASIQDYADLPSMIIGADSYLQETGFLQKKLPAVTAKNPDTATGYSTTFENKMYGPENWKIGPEDTQMNSIRDLVLIRYADVLLMQAELKEDAGPLNQVRARAGLNPIGSYSLEALQNERRWELAFEGTRWNDIRRWHIAAAALEKQAGVPVYFRGEPGTNTPNDYAGYAARYNATAGFCKIPENQVSLSNGGIVQNLGWDGTVSDFKPW